MDSKNQEKGKRITSLQLIFSPSGNFIFQDSTYRHFIYTYFSAPYPWSYLHPQTDRNHPSLCSHSTQHRLPKLSLSEPFPKPCTRRGLQLHQRCFVVFLFHSVQESVVPFFQVNDFGLEESRAKEDGRRMRGLWTRFRRECLSLHLEIKRIYSQIFQALMNQAIYNGLQNMSVVNHAAKRQQSLKTKSYGL